MSTASTSTSKTALLQTAIDKGAAAQRLNRREAEALITGMGPDSLHRLGAAALQNRRQRFDDRATFVANIQINPSNICSGGCRFCTYAAAPGDPHAYSLDESEIIDEVTRIDPVEVHIVGGLNRQWPYARNRDLVAALRQRFPALHIKAFTAVEIDFFSRQTGLPVSDLLAELSAAGVNALTGGGAELFSPAFREAYWPEKIPPETWLGIHHQAHGAGLPTNATMLFGMGETWRERLDHLFTLRDAQAHSGGFQCFIPLAYQSGGGIPGAPGPTPNDILAVTAVSRLVLDNVDHIKCYWPMIGLETAAVALSWGGDDLDGTIRRERIAHMAGADTPVGLARAQMIDTIRTGGFQPVERNGRFSPLTPSTGSHDQPRSDA